MDKPSGHVRYPAKPCKLRRVGFVPKQTNEGLLNALWHETVGILRQVPSVRRFAADRETNEGLFNARRHGALEILWLVPSVGRLAATLGANEGLFNARWHGTVLILWPMLSLWV